MNRKKFTNNNVTSLFDNKKFGIDMEHLLTIEGNICTFWKDSNGIYKGCNNKTAELLQFTSSKDIIGMTDFDLPCSPEELNDFRHTDLIAINTGQALNWYKTVTVSDYVIQMSAFKAPIFDHNQKIIGVYGINSILSISTSKNLSVH